MPPLPPEPPPERYTPICLPFSPHIEDPRKAFPRSYIHKYSLIRFLFALHMRALFQRSYICEFSLIRFFSHTYRRPYLKASHTYIEAPFSPFYICGRPYSKALYTYVDASFFFFLNHMFMVRSLTNQQLDHSSFAPIKFHCTLVFTYHRQDNLILYKLILV